MTNRQLKSLIMLLKAQGCTEYSTPELSLKLDLNFDPKPFESVTEPISDKPQYSEDDTLFWSSPSMDEDKEV